MTTFALKHLFVVLLLTLQAFMAIETSMAQTKIDELVLKLDQLEGLERVEPLILLADLLSRNDMDKADNRINEAVDISEQFDDLNLLGKALALRAGMHFRRQQYSQMDADVEKVLELSAASNDSEIACRVSVVGILGAKNRSRYAKALEYSDRGLRECEIARNGGYHWLNFFNAAAVHEESGNLHTAREMLEKLRDAEGDLLELGNVNWSPRNKASVENNLGKINLESGRLEDALANFKNAFSHVENSDNDRAKALYTYNSGDTLLRMGEFQEGLEKILNADITFQKLGFVPGQVGVLANSGKAYRGLGDETKAISRGIAALQLFETSEKGDSKLEMEIRQELIESYRNFQRFEEAAMQMQELNELLEERYSQERAVSLAEFHATLETNEKQRDLDRLQLTQQLQELEISRQNNVLMTTAFAVAFLLAGLCIIGWFAIRQRRLNLKLKYANEELDRNVAQREELVREINHRVKNNLQVILGLLQLQKFRLEENSEHGEVAKGVLRDIEGRIQAIALIHRQLHRNELSVEVELRPFFTELVDQLKELYKGVAEVVIDVSDITLELDQAVPLGLVTSELISNSIEHAFPDQQNDAKIEISLLEQNDLLEIQIKDNGIGFDRTIIDHPDPTNLGLVLVRNLITQVDGELTLGEVETPGTLWTITIEKWKDSELASG